MIGLFSKYGLLVKTQDWENQKILVLIPHSTTDLLCDLGTSLGFSEPSFAACKMGNDKSSFPLPLSAWSL